EGEKYLITEGKYAGKYVILLKKGYDISAGDIEEKDFKIESEVEG
ncbi:unnamed protein product, partial [marine sediment metagenome]